MAGGSGLTCPSLGSSFEDETLKLRQLKLENQRALLEKKQRKKRLEPLMVQPNPEAKLCKFKSKVGEEQAPLVEPSARACTNVVLHGIDGPAIFLKPAVQELGDKHQIISVGSYSTEEDNMPEKTEETQTNAASKVALQDILQKQVHPKQQQKEQQQRQQQQQ